VPCETLFRQWPEIVEEAFYAGSKGRLWRGLMEALTRNRSPLWFQMSCVPVTDPSGNATAVVFLGLDVTARLERQSLTNGEQSMNQLARHLTHEIPNPLTTLRGHLELVALRTPDERVRWTCCWTRSTA
jgi:nitrogen-specific signal transduction histidine kinase